MEPIGRKEELEELNAIYESPRFEFGYVYGQRRIGKTTLMEMFSRGKKALFLFAPDSDDLDIRIYFSEELNRAMGRSGGLYPDWDSFFHAVGQFFGDEKGLLVIDEYPNSVLSRDRKRKKTGFPSFLQKAIDGIFRHQRFTLVLTGSNVSFIEREIKDSHGPLYQRNTFSIQLRKLNFEDAVLALKDVEDDWEKARFLALTNTFPYYLSLIDTKRSFQENLRRLFYDRSATFIDDPSKIITCDAATSGFYASLIQAISMGRDSISAISDFYQESTSKVAKYLSQLVEDNVIIRRTSFQSKRNVTYEIFDPMLAFFYRFIRNNVELIRSGLGHELERRQRTAVKGFLERLFEKECLTYLQDLGRKGMLKGLYSVYENMHVDNSALLRSIELDVVASDQDNLLVAECKFSSQPRGIGDYKRILEDISVPPLSNYRNVEIFLFGANGFTDGLREVQDERLRLIDLKTMFSLD